MSKKSDVVEEQTEGGYTQTEIPEVIEQISVEQESENRTQLKRIIEAILFASPNPLPFNKIRDVVQSVEELKPKEIRTLMDELADEYETQNRAFCLQEIAEGYVLRTRPEYSQYLDQVFRNKKVERLSHSATEVLAIVAYRQPITRPQIEEIRGVDSSGVLASLMERQLVESCGKLEAPGRPTLYGTTKLFLEHYGLKSVKDMPDLGLPPINEVKEEEEVEAEQTTVEEEVEQAVVEEEATAEEEKGEGEEMKDENGQQEF